MILPRFALKTLALAALSLTAATSTFAADTSCDNCFQKRWIYFGGNIVDDTTRQKLIEVIGMAKTLGYNGIAYNAGGEANYSVMLTPSKMSSKYNASFKAVLDEAKRNDIELIPVGGGMEVPAVSDPELIEAFPVNATPFIAISGGVAVPVGASLLAELNDQSFEKNDPAWKLIDSDAGTISYDNIVSHSGSRSVKFTQPLAGKASRLFRALHNLRPRSAYRMTYWIRAENYDAPFQIKVLQAGSVMPMYQNASAGLGWTSVGGGWATAANVLPTATPDTWVQYSIDFNTGNFSDLDLYIGSWSRSAAGTGTVWMDDIDIKEIGLAHTIRRKQSLPVTVSSADGSITYVEGKDYTVDVEKLILPQTTSISEGQELRVSSYQSAKNMFSMFTTPANACSGDYFNIQKANFDNISGLMSTSGPWKPSKYFMYYDENRVFNWDELNCQATFGKVPTAGEYLSETFRKHQEIISANNPGVELFVWHDMFDPNSNAVPQYWGVNGTLYESWLGIKPTTTIVNWTDSINQHPVTSLKFFSDKNLKQIIAGYYDDSSVELKEVKAWMDALDTAEAQGVKGVNGFMYTTFKGINGYQDLTRVTQFIKDKYGKRWPQ
ncbi:hypothetical protein LPN04_26525 [Rugamonas sp. A1-17]|nr:hypothetical protein [Rugamonas sp. A1-17]